MKPRNTFKDISLSVIWTWLTLFALIPFGLIIAVSFLSHDANNLFKLPLTLTNYQELFNPAYLHVFTKSVIIAGISTFFCLLLGYPFAYILARTESRWKNLLLLLVIIPFWTSSLIRSYALIAIIKANGVLNTLLMKLGLIEQPLNLLFTNTAAIIGLTYNLLPFMIIPIMTNVERLDNNFIEAAYDLGASRFITFRKIIIPLTMPGIISGIIMVFIPAMTLFYITDILGGAKSMLLGNLIQSKFLVAQNWPLGSAISTMLTAALAALILIYLAARRKSKGLEAGE